MDIFGNKKRKLKEQELAERQQFLDNNSAKTTQLQEENNKLQSSVIELMHKNQLLNEDLNIFVKLFSPFCII